MKKILLNKDDINNLELIKTKKDCAQQAIYNIPEFISLDEIDYCIKSAIDAYGAYTWLEKNWWDNIKKIYNISTENIHIDFSTGELYINE